MDKDIDIYKWVMDELSCFHRFLTWWLRQSNKNPDIYPRKMSDGDWFEQYTIWRENNNP